MNEIFRQTLLLDFYGALLTQRQQEICRMHLLEDWSLGEIAQEMGISRQAISDAIRKSEASMEKTEQQLHMVERYVYLTESAEALEELVLRDASKEELLESIHTLRERLIPKVSE
ncbi:MAG: DNA-binding protein [Lachnospiraceae bacterium]|nr:DNA-binding protein [Lachnospiraceae bacterium]